MSSSFSDPNWKPRAKDIPAQLGLDGQYVSEPDEACLKNAVPLVPPVRVLPQVKEKRRRFNLNSHRTADGREIWMQGDDFVDASDKPSVPLVQNRPIRDWNVIEKPEDPQNKYVGDGEAPF